MSDRRQNGHSTVELPREWRRDKIARLCDFVGSGGTPPTGNPDFYDGGIPWVQTGDLTDDCLDETAKTITEKGLRNSAARLYPKNTLLVAMYGATIGKLGILKFAAAVNQACCALVVRKTVDMRFMFYTLRSMRADLIADGLGGGQQNIGQETIKQKYIVHPPLPEQQRIAAYLDASCAAIDAAVSAKRRQLETLDELCSSILLRAITLGISDGVQTISTGSSALPLIPNGWRLDRLKSVASIRYGLGQPPAELASGVAMIRATDVDGGKIYTDNLLRVDPDALPRDRNPYLKPGEIIVVRSGAYTGDSAIVPSELEGAVAGYDMVVTATRASSRFIAYGLLSRYVLQGQILLLTLRAAQPHLNAEELGSVIMALPPTRKEQEAIADFLDTKLADMERLVTGIKTQIATLKDYRKSLIHECVTGQRRIAEADLNHVKGHG